MAADKLLQQPDVTAVRAKAEALVRSNATLAFAAERQVVSQTNGPMDEDESFKEFCEDFSAPGPDEAALERLLAHARALGDVDMRRLVGEVKYWRFLGPILLDRLAPRGTPVDEADPILAMARFQIRGEGGIGRKKA